MEAKRQVRAVAVMSIFAALIVIAMLVSLNTGYIRLVSFGGTENVHGTGDG